MRIATFDDGRLGVVDGDEVIDVTEQVAAGPGSSAMLRLVRSGATVTPAGPRHPLAAVRLRAPLPDPSKVFAAPVNYRSHQDEMASPSDVSHLGLFLKSPSSIVGPHDVVELPYADRRFDQEGELAVVIGRRARSVAEADALGHVFGYTALIDVTMRGGEDRSTRKSFETFTPTGPWIVTADEFGDPGAVELRCSVSGELRQHANTRDLLWPVSRLIAYASSITTLEPGDLLSTGTPDGVGPLEDGDTIRLDVGRIGAPLEVSVRRLAGRSPTLGHDGGYLPVIR